MSVGVVVVTHRSEHVLDECLTSLNRHEPEATVVVVDNATPGGPPGADATLVALKDNVGYGAACNAGVRHLPETDVIAFLNPDVRLAGPSLTQLSRRLACRPRVGIATGPVIDPEGGRVPSAWGPTSAVRALWFGSGWRAPRIRAAAGRLIAGGAFTSAASIAEEDLRVDGHVLGGAMVVRRETWEELGGFDEGFFLYWEDADLCARARALGWELAVLPCRPIVHAAGASSAGVSEEQRWSWYLEGAQRFAEHHLSAAAGRRLLWALRAGRRLRR